jgi:hypothetical protein
MAVGSWGRLTPRLGTMSRLRVKSYARECCLQVTEITRNLGIGAKAGIKVFSALSRRIPQGCGPRMNGAPPTERLVLKGEL